jgi:cytoskeletal protein CcmA (bactofilin family)
MKKILKNRKGISLMLVYVLLTLVVVVLGVIFYMSIQSMKISQRRIDFIRAFYAAESGIDVGLRRLPIDSVLLPVSPISGILGSPDAVSEYMVSIDSFEGSDQKRIINSTGFVPDRFSVPRVEVEIEVLTESVGPGVDFFSSALYSATDLTIKGSAYTIDGDVFYDQDSDIDIQHPDNITGDINTGESVDFLSDIDYDILRDAAISQGLSDTYDHHVDPDTWQGSNLPSDFWYDEAAGMPNIIYVDGTGDIDMSGNMNLGGFIVVASGDCQISGTVYIEGCLLVLGDLNIVGTVDVTGGVWASGNISDEETDSDGGVIVKGSVGIVYEAGYMDALETLDFMTGEYSSEGTRVLSWQEKRRQAISG